MIIFSILLIVLVVASFFLFGSLYKSTTKHLFKILKYAVSGFMALILCVTFIGRGLCIVDSNEIGIVRTFGKINREVTEGLNFVNPISDKVVKFDRRIHVRQEAFASYTRDAQPVTASIEYQYQLMPDFALDIAQEYGTYEILETKLANVVQEKAKIVFAKYSAMPLLENRSNLSNEVKTEVESLEDLFHVQFTSVIVKDLDFSDAFEASVEAKMTAEQDALRAEQEKKTAVVKAEQSKEVAAIEAEAKVTEAKGEAEAIEIKRKALQNMPEAYVQSLWIEKWNGELPATMTSEGSAVVVNPKLED